jgi:hypothetical protein
VHSCGGAGTSSPSFKSWTLSVVLIDILGRSAARVSDNSGKFQQIVPEARRGISAYDFSLKTPFIRAQRRNMTKIDFADFVWLCRKK